MKKLEGKVAVITGGNSGIGLATAQRFVSEGGAYVFITGRRQSELDAAVRQIGKNNVSGVQGDVSNLADLDRLYAEVKEQKGHIDILFANAGVGELAPLCEITGPNIDIAIKLIKRMKGLFEPKLGLTFSSKETVLELNGCTIKAYPSNHIDAYRALDNPKFILLDVSLSSDLSDQMLNITVCFV